MDKLVFQRKIITRNWNNVKKSFSMDFLIEY